MTLCGWRAVIRIKGYPTVCGEQRTFGDLVDHFINSGASEHHRSQFRIWATQRLKEYLIKGFVLDDERLKKSGGGNYFDELLARIRDIRSSEKVFWRKVLDIYSTSIDYNPQSDLSEEFFAIRHLA